MQRLEGLQVLRALAAIAVVFYHTFYALTLHKDPCWLCQNESWRKSMIFGVDVFFVISGFIVSTVAERETSPFRFLLKRVWKIVPLYYAVSLIEYQWKTQAGHQPTLEQVWRSMVFLRQPGGPVLIHGWTLVYEMWFYSATAVLLLFGFRRIGIWGCLVMLAMGLYQWPLLLLFAGGCAIGEAAKVVVAPRWLGALMLLGGLGWWTWLSWQGASFGPSFNWEAAFGNHQWRVERYALPALLVVAGTVLPSWRSAQMPKLLVFLGDASYPIYICQQIGLVYAGMYVERVHGMPYAILTTLLCVAIGVTVHLAWERPFGQAWRRIYDLPFLRTAELRETPGAIS
ncbi:MAG: acyltransferase [Acidobacteria bacterium]|nr:acyltransferase [Acidobacteriota bacterium]